MKLGDILRKAGTAQPISPRDVDVWVAGRDASLNLVKAQAKAKLVYVDEERRAALRVDAATYLNKQYQGKVIPEDVVDDEQDIRHLFEALKDSEPNADGQYQPFAANVDELRSALTKQEHSRLFGEFQLYMLEEFPRRVSDVDFAAMVEDAKKVSATDLLTKYGFASAVMALRSLVGRSGR